MAAEMSELRCPMCGKINSAELDICQFCQARLVPIRAAEQTPASDPGANSAKDDSSIDDWLSSLRSSDEHPADENVEAEGHQEPFDAGVPDWLQDDSQAGAQESRVPTADASGADWLGSLLQREEETGPLAEGLPPEGQAAEDWPPTSQLPGDDSIPEWLSQIGKQEQPSEPTPSDEAQAPEANVPEARPDWLSRIRSLRIAEASTATEVAAGEETPAQPDAEDSVSAWLAELRGDEAVNVEDLSTLAELPQETPAEELAVEEFLPGESADQIPARIEQSTPVQPEIAAPAVPEEKEAPEITQGPEDQIPDWLAGLVTGKAIASGMTKVETDAEGLPDWLADLEKSSTLDQGVIVPFGEEEPGLTFDWLQEQVRADQRLSTSGKQPAAEAQPGEAIESISPFEGDLSDFLEEGYAKAPRAEVASGETEAELRPAELPTWLEAMRPIEAAAFALLSESERETQVESSGPLAGLRGVLPAEPDIARMKKPPAYALRLQVSDSQQVSADLLEGLVKTEAEPKALPERPVISSQYIFRLVIFAALLLPIIWAAFTRSQNIPLPALPQEVFDTTSLINALPDNPLILLAVDYEPGLSGEMQAASSALIDQLMLKGAYLAMVSTSPNGPALAEGLIRNVAGRSAHQYQDINQYANLGFIPGGPAGLASFAEAPRKITPYALDPESTYVWGREPMQAATQLSDFNLVAVLTDNADKARAWIEQVQPSLESTPLVMVVSAQAEPMVRPYYYSSEKQVQGLVVGLAGSGAYENAHRDLVSGSGPARQYWDAFSYSLLVAAMLVAVGVVINLTASGIAARKQSVGEKKP